RACRLVDHHAVLREQALAPFVGDGIDDRDESLLGVLEFLVALDDGGSAAAVCPDAQAELLDAVRRRLHRGELLRLPSRSHPALARAIERLVEVLRRYEDLRLLVTHPAGIANGILEAKQSVVGGVGDDLESRELDQLQLLDDRTRAGERLALEIAHSPAIRDP